MNSTQDEKQKAIDEQKEKANEIKKELTEMGFPKTLFKVYKNGTIMAEVSALALYDYVCKGKKDE